MKTVRHFGSARDKILHVETDGGIVNIQIGLSDSQGRSVTSVSVVPDAYAEQGGTWDLAGLSNTRLIQRAAGETSTVHTFTVTVTGCTTEQATQVMTERIGPDEDYGFDYSIEWG